MGTVKCETGIDEAGVHVRFYHVFVWEESGVGHLWKLEPSGLIKLKTYSLLIDVTLTGK